MSPATRTFIRHYLEMVLAMMLGMGVLGIATLAFGEIEDTAASLVAMGAAMTIPMVWWMRHRGHGWAPCLEMSAAMVLPTLLALGLLWAGTVEDEGTLMAIDHSIMFPAMLVAMLLRPREYTGHAHHAHAHA